jgi:predicted DNA-binding protein with PD1-like motif
MKYQVGRVGRCVVARFDHGDDILGGLSRIAETERIRAAVFYLVGGITHARIVVGPRQEELPPEPVWRSLDESHETVGVGTIFWQGDVPRIHFHGVYGKRDTVRAGCLREDTSGASVSGEAPAALLTEGVLNPNKAETFIVLEAVILEIEGVEATRGTDAASGMVLLTL